ncbi:MAG: hypothetical protein ACK4PG_13040 [Acetobacteraceae bacterium]
MRLAMILGALGLVFLLPVADATANQRQQDRAAAQQPRAAVPQAQRTAAPAARQAAQPQRTAAAARPAAQSRQAAQGPSTRQQPAQAAAQRTGVFRSAAAAPAGMPRATGSCTRRDAQGRCIRTTTSNTRWQGGLPPMTMAQQECPSGTVATLARGHANVVRCLPI